MALKIALVKHFRHLPCATGERDYMFVFFRTHRSTETEVFNVLLARGEVVDAEWKFSPWVRTQVNDSETYAEVGTVVLIHKAARGESHVEFMLAHVPDLTEMERERLRAELLLLVGLDSCLIGSEPREMVVLHDELR